MTRNVLPLLLILLCGAPSAATQPRSDQALSRAQRASDTASRAQERAAAAQERGAAAQDRAGRASGASERASQAAAAGLRTATQARSESGLRATFGRQLQRVRDLVAANPLTLELFENHAIVRSELVGIDPSEAVLETARRQGFVVTRDETVEGLGTRFVSIRVPAGTTIGAAVAKLRQIAPDTTFTPNHIHLQSGTGVSGSTTVHALAPSRAVGKEAIGIIDGGVAASQALPPLEQRGFAEAAPAASSHGTAVASLLSATNLVRSSAPGSPLLIADVYGRDPRGGNALAIARALGWLKVRGAPVIVMSLVGPPNPIVARAISEVRNAGIQVVAPVGNAGPAAPPMYPAAYPGVIGVTGVDRRNRILIEAGRGAHVDYSGPAAGIAAMSLDGRSLTRVRGTSYAAPLVAGQLWAARRSPDPARELDKAAVDLGAKGPDPVFGRGLVCSFCR